MSHAMDSKSAAAVLLDPLSQPEPSAEDGPGSHFGNTYAPAHEINGISRSSTTSSNNPYRNDAVRPNRSSSIQRSPPNSKSGATATIRTSPDANERPEKFPAYRAEAFQDYPSSSSRSRAASHGTPPTYQEATSPRTSQLEPLPERRRRGSSLKERYPGDKSTQPLDVIRRDSKKAYRSPHLNKKSLPGADSIDRLDPAIGGRAYHHEGPYDAALLSRNRDPKTAPLKALEVSNAEALRATPRENIKDAVERHQPLDGVAAVAPGHQDRFGRRYDYEEGADLMHEPSSGDPGYKRWPDKSYDSDDLTGKAEPSFSLDRALRAHKISDNDGAMELQDRSRISRDYHDAERRGDLDRRDPVTIAGGEERYADMEIAAMNASADADPRGQQHQGTLGSLKKRIGSLRRKDRDD